MFATNPFAAVSPSLPANAMQVFVMLAVLAVVAGVLLDMAHKGSATYFFANWRRTRGQGRPVDAASIAVQTAVVDVLTSGEFCNPAAPRRAPAGDVRLRALRVTTVMHGVRLPDAGDAAPPSAQLWWIGAPDGLRRRLLVLVLHPRRCRGRGRLATARHARRPVHPLAAGERDARPDLGLAAGGGARPACSSVCTCSPRRCCSPACYWSKFAHMFFKPAAAFEKRIAEADGTNREPADANARRPEQQQEALDGTAARTLRWTWGSASSAKRPATTDHQQPASSTGSDKEPEQCLPSSI
jgi:hypothetical protein